MSITAIKLRGSALTCLLFWSYTFYYLKRENNFLIKKRLDSAMLSLKKS